MISTLQFLIIIIIFFFYFFLFLFFFFDVHGLYIVAFSIPESTDEALNASDIHYVFLDGRSDLRKTSAYVRQLKTEKHMFESVISVSTPSPQSF
jgi:hypothetical protein